MRWPSRDGLPAPAHEVLLPESKLPDRPWNKNNHHLLFPRCRYMAGGIIYATLRDLDSMQVDLPKDVHNQGKHTLHTWYQAPHIPSPGRAVDYLLEAFERGEELRYGCSRDPQYLPFTPELMGQILDADFKEAVRATR